MEHGRCWFYLDRLEYRHQFDAVDEFDTATSYRSRVHFWGSRQRNNVGWWRGRSVDDDLNWRRRFHPWQSATTSAVLHRAFQHIALPLRRFWTALEDTR